MSFKICSCGEKYDFEGWNIKEIIRFGNNYCYRRTKHFSIKYTTCSKCGKQVILSKSKFGKVNG